jgi:hypothetical protein
VRPSGYKKRIRYPGVSYGYTLYMPIHGRILTNLRRTRHALITFNVAIVNFYIECPALYPSAARSIALPFRHSYIPASVGWRSFRLRVSSHRGGLAWILVPRRNHR